MTWLDRCALAATIAGAALLWVARRLSPEPDPPIERPDAAAMTRFMTRHREETRHR